mgnify:CR=1 FL=1
MIKQSLAFNDILEKKFKILRTSIVLGNLRNKEETLSEYEDTAREIDKIKSRVYEELLGAKVYTTVSLEEEGNRLKELIAFIEKRNKSGKLLNETQLKALQEQATRDLTFR